MPATAPQQEADVESTNQPVNRQDVSAGGANEADTDSNKASSQIATHGNISTTSSSLPGEEINNHSVDPTRTISKNGRQTSQDGVLHIPSEGGVTMHPIETSTWGWDTPPETVGEPSSYLYEPQGELLHEEREQRGVETEFSIPHAVSGSGIQWPFSASPVDSGRNDGFAIPKRPSGIPPPIAGIKRKSTFDREAPGLRKHQDQKRGSRIMSESGGEDPTSPAHNTRSQSGTSTRPRSQADTSEGRSRPLPTEFDPVSDLGSRTLSDPSIPMVLPARKVFPIQIGDKLFRLSGASISSDGKHCVNRMRA